MNFNFLIISDTAKPDFFKPREIINKGRLDVIGRFLQTSFEGETLLKPINVFIALLGDSNNKKMFAVQKDQLETLTEPLIADFLSNYVTPDNNSAFDADEETWKKMSQQYFPIILEENAPFLSPDLINQLKRNQKNKELLFILGAQNDPPKDVLNYFRTYSINASLGSTSYLSSQVATIIRFLLTISQ